MADRKKDEIDTEASGGANTPPPGSICELCHQPIAANSSWKVSPVTGAISHGRGCPTPASDVPPDKIRLGGDEYVTFQAPIAEPAPVEE